MQRIDDLALCRAQTGAASGAALGGISGAERERRRELRYVRDHECEIIIRDIEDD